MVLRKISFFNFRISACRAGSDGSMFASGSAGFNILNSCPTQGRVEGWDAMKPRYCRSVSSKSAGRPRLTHHHKGWGNETKWMRWGWRNGGMKFVVGENGRNPEKNLPRPRFVHHEIHMEGPRRELGTPTVGDKHLTACATSRFYNTNLGCILYGGKNFQPRG